MKSGLGLGLVDLSIGYVTDNDLHTGKHVPQKWQIFQISVIH